MTNGMLVHRNVPGDELINTTRFDREAERFERPRKFEVLKIPEAPDGAKIIVVNDTQIPFQDVATLEAVQHFWDDFAPDLEIYNGDIIDFYSISDFIKDPSRTFKLQDELDEAYQWMFSRAEANPNARRILIQGNHEDRLRRFLAKAGPELSSLTSLEFESLMRLDDLQMETISYRSQVDFLGFLIEHGWKASGGGTPYPINVSRFMASKTGSSGLCGHTHRISLYGWANANGSHSYIENGCLCRMDLEYAPFPNWQQAFSFGVVQNNKVHMNLVQIYPDGFRTEGEWYPRIEK